MLSPDALELNQTLMIVRRIDESLLVAGGVEIRNAPGQVIYRSSDAALCRCGGSSNKPFCDGTHEQIGFKAE